MRNSEVVGVKVIIGLVQSNSKVGDLQGNKRSIVKAIRDTSKDRVDLLLFPELAVTGYPPKDLLDYEGFVRLSEKVLKEVASTTSAMPVVCGFVEKNPSLTGAPFFNSAALLQHGKVKKVYRKQLLPNYDIFDEKRYFEPGSDSCLFSVGKARIAVTICEDAWNFPGFLSRKHQHQPLKKVREMKPHFVLSLSASPFSLGKPALRQSVFHAAAKYVGAPFVICNQVGGNDECLFDGCSFVVAPNGKLLARGKAFQEDIVFFDAEKKVDSTQWPLWPANDGEWLFDALKMGLQDYAKKCGIQNVCLGLSGGIDSSVTAVVAAEALGRERVSGLSLPTRFTSPQSLEDAKKLAQTLGIEFHELSIEPLFENFRKHWKSWFGKEASGLTSENIQPRLRMAVLMAFANEEGRLLLNTSNKSEIATGYATLYGDSAGALSVLGDLTKKQVYELAHLINSKSPVIPERVLKRPPSAELREGQTDEQTLPPYSFLDDMVVKAIEYNFGPEEIRRSGVPAKWVKRFGYLHALSEYKRHQLPPVLRVSTRCFGFGRRMPIAADSPFWKG